MKAPRLYNAHNSFRCLAGLFLVMICCPLLRAQQTFSFSAGRIKHRISFGPVISTYRNHPQMTTGTKASLGFTASYKTELFMGRQTNLLFGLDYLNQHFSFNGYYKAPGNTYLFDGTFPYTHEVRFSELQTELCIKKAFNDEKEMAVTPYFSGGVGARYILNSYFVITNDSTGVSPYDGKGDLQFEHQFLTKRLNAFYHAGFGIQKNRRQSGKAVFLEVVYKFGLSRLHYDGHDNSNDLNIRNNMLCISVGWRL